MSRARLLTLCLLLIFLSAPAIAQEAKRSSFIAVSDGEFDLITQFYAYDKSYPLDTRIVEIYEEDSYTLEKIVFTNSLDERVPAYLAKPQSDSTSRPCVILLHGLNDSKDKWWDHDIDKHVTGELLAAGIAVFAPDLRYHGERSAMNNYQAPMYLTFGNEYFVRSRNMIIQSTIDVRRALDYLGTRSDIDKSRIAVLGYSMGGMISLYLSAIESDRIAAAVACSTPTGEQPLPIDPFQFAHRNQTVPILLLMGKEDWFGGEKDAQLLLRTIDSEKKELTLFESGHRLPVDYTIAAANWLNNRLK